MKDTHIKVRWRGEFNRPVTLDLRAISMAHATKDGAGTYIELISGKSMTITASYIEIQDAMADAGIKVKDLS